MKKAYYCYEELTNGKFYDEMMIPENFETRVPIVAVQIPKGMILPKFDWFHYEWKEMALEVLQKENEQLKQELENLKGDVK